MVSRSVAAFFLAQLLVAACALAQSSSEFSRASGGSLDLTPKATNQFSFSLGITYGQSSSTSLLPGRQYFASGGGAVIPDRLWVFGTGQLASSTNYAPRFTNADFAKFAARVSDRSNLTGFASSLPSSFQSLHFTGMPSNSSTFSLSVSHETAKPAVVPVVPVP